MQSVGDELSLVKFLKDRFFEEMKQTDQVALHTTILSLQTPVFRGFCSLYCFFLKHSPSFKFTAFSSMASLLFLSAFCCQTYSFSLSFSF